MDYLLLSRLERSRWSLDSYDASSLLVLLCFHKDQQHLQDQDHGRLRKACLLSSAIRTHYALW